MSAFAPPTLRHRVAEESYYFFFGFALPSGLSALAFAAFSGNAFTLDAAAFGVLSVPLVRFGGAFVRCLSCSLSATFTCARGQNPISRPSGRPSCSHSR